jgi:ribosome biogenesis protein ENP2
VRAATHSIISLQVTGSSSSIFRLNLEQGIFRQPFETALSTGVNCCAVAASSHSLLAFGGENGVVEFWDPRVRASVASLDIALRLGADATVSDHVNVLAREAPAVTALTFAFDGMTLGVGASSGHVALFDLRSSRPLHVKDHRYGLPIVHLSFHEGCVCGVAPRSTRALTRFAAPPSSGRHDAHARVISADRQIVKVWDRRGDFSNFCSIEPQVGAAQRVPRHTLVPIHLPPVHDCRRGDRTDERSRSRRRRHTACADVLCAGARWRAKVVRLLE